MTKAPVGRLFRQTETSSQLQNVAESEELRLPFVPVEDAVNRATVLTADLARNLDEVFDELFEIHLQNRLSFRDVSFLPSRSDGQQQRRPPLQ